MRKTGIILSAVIIIIVFAVFAISLSLNKAVKAGVETFGPKITKTDISLAEVNISALSGKGAIKGLVVGNPEGFKTEHAIKLGSMQVALDTRSAFSDHVIVERIVIDSPEITYETGLTENNISRILKNIQMSTQAAPSKEETKPQEASPGKKMQINDLLISNGKINLSSKLMQGKAVIIPLREIHLTDIGKESDGADISQVVEKVFRSFNESVVEAVAQSAKELSTSVESMEKAGEAVKEEASGLIKGLKDVFKKE